jgi:hypothetical protein
MAARDAMARRFRRIGGTRSFPYELDAFEPEKLLALRDFDGAEAQAVDAGLLDLDGADDAGIVLLRVTVAHAGALFPPPGSYSHTG